MELILLRVFQRQIQLQCQAIVVGSHDFNSAMTTGDSTHAWIAIQNILTAAANVSKALWGQRGKFANQRAPLRASLQVDDTSPFRVVAMRNHFEHYDERLDTWWRDSPSHNHFDMSFVPPGQILGLADIDMFRVFDPSTANVVFWGEHFNIQDIVREAARLVAIAATEASKPHFEPPDLPSTAGSGQ